MGPLVSSSRILHMPLSTRAQKVLVMQITGVAITSLSEQMQLTQRADDMHAASRNFIASFKHPHISKSVPQGRHG